MSLQRKIPEEFIEEVRGRADIVSVVSEYMDLKRAGRNYQGLCPFHGEKTPSFHVNVERQMFYCFGCHAGGNVFSFLMQKEHVTFREAVQKIAQKVGMELPEEQLSPREQAELEAKKRWQYVYQLAMKYYRDVLISHPDGAGGRDYLKIREVDEAASARFLLGYAPNRWDALISAMAAKGVHPEELERLGLAVKRGDGTREGYYDRFRARLMFPILDLRSEPIAFGGRVLDDIQPKYLNSPETKFFHKGQNLYGMHTAFRSMREFGFALLVEGYMDVIAVQKAGFLQAVASLGTSLTREQAKVLHRYAERVIIGYDMDEAGRAATLRAGDILMSEGLRVEVLQLEGVKDPDEYLRKNVPDDFAQALQKTLTFIEFKFKELLRAHKIRTIPDKAAVIRRLAPDILKISSSVEREGYERFLSSELGLTLDAVREEVRNQKEKGKEHQGYREKFLQEQDISVKNRNTIEKAVSESPPKAAVPLGIFRAEQLILRLVLEQPAWQSEVVKELGRDFWLVEEHRYLFENGFGSDIYAEDDQRYQQSQKRLAEIYAETIDSGKKDDLLRDCILTIKQFQEKKSVEELQGDMIRLEKAGDMAGALAILQKIEKRLKENDT